MGHVDQALEAGNFHLQRCSAKLVGSTGRDLVNNPTRLIRLRASPGGVVSLSNIQSRRFAATIAHTSLEAV